MMTHFFISKIRGEIDGIYTTRRTTTTTKTIKMNRNRAYNKIMVLFFT